MRYTFADCLLDIEQHQIFRNGDPVKVEPQVFDLLHLLVQSAGTLVTRDEIVKRIWDGRIVSESAISARINAARKAVGDTGKDQAVIKTVTRRGLQLAVPVILEQEGEAELPPVPPSRQRVRFATSADGTKIAYAVSGSGPPVLRAGHFLTHLEMDWRSVIWRPYLDALGAAHTLVRYDQRGTGMSDPELTDTSLSAYVSDLKAVADAAGLDRFPVIALSQGVPVAISFAVKYPERVSALVLGGGYAEGRVHRDGGASKDAGEAMLTMIREGWGKPESAFMGAFTTLFCPGASRQQLADLVAMQLASTSADNAVRIRQAIDRFTVVDLLASLKVPVLVMHNKDDSVHPVSEGRRLAANIPGADFQMLGGRNHIMLPDEPAWADWVAATLEFIAAHE